MNAEYFAYRDNEVLFDIDPSVGLTLREVSFNVDSYFITKGQDPDGHIYQNLLASSVNTNPNGLALEISFSIGRKGSEETAAWFSERVKSNQTTFDHEPGKLNFALMGTLTLITGLPNDPNHNNLPPLVFNNIALAQGHIPETGANNWWFGGPNCSYIGDHQVRALCASNNSSYRFQRGFNLPVNRIHFFPGS